MRVQSPSSINTYRQCPRKYYYNYIKKLPTKQSIHLLRGKLVHSVLEEFYVLNKKIDTDYFTFFQKRVISDFTKKWEEGKDELTALKLGEESLSHHYKETLLMLINWVNDFSIKFGKRLRQEPDYNEAFKILTPITEEEFVSEELSVRGFVDAIEIVDGKVKIVDYKTSGSSVISDSQLIQIGIYAALYKEKHKKIPDFASLYFLREGEKEVKINDKLIEFALKELNEVHKKTESVDINDYPKKVSALCKWSSGQCDFYEECFK